MKKSLGYSIGVILLGIIVFIVSRHRTVSFYVQDKEIDDNIIMINANLSAEENQMIASIEPELLSGISYHYESISLLNKVELNDNMLGYRLIFSYGDGVMLFIRTIGKDVWYIDVYGKNGLGPCYNIHSKCESIGDMIINTRIPTKVIDIVLIQDNKQTILLGTGGDRFEQVRN